MEILIPGLILVALMAWASTKIKKRAADAFQAELVETDDYTIRKPEGFLHVLGDVKHDFMAYSREFGADENSRVRRATIEVDLIRDAGLQEVRQLVSKNASHVEIRSETERVCEVIAKETANQTSLSVFYKIICGDAIYRLRFAAITEHLSEYERKIDETLDSFNLKAN
jgi:hypothetical protein